MKNMLASQQHSSENINYKETSFNEMKDNMPG